MNTRVFTGQITFHGCRSRQLFLLFIAVILVATYLLFQTRLVQVNSCTTRRAKEESSTSRLLLDSVDDEESNDSSSNDDDDGSEISLDNELDQDVTDRLTKEQEKPAEEKIDPTDEEEDDDDPRPRNFHAAIIGDSVSRYQYMTLGFFLHHGRHPSKAAGDRGPILSQYNDDIYEFKNTYLLEPHGVCDCFRTVKWKPSAFCENRYFYDPVRNNSLTYLLKYGHADVQGHWKPDQVHDNSHQIHVSSEEDDRYAWKGNWTVALRHLAALVPKPEYVIFNAGHHPNNFNQSNVQEEIANTLHELDMVGVYKTSTCERGGTPSKYAAHEQDENQRQALCQRFHCLEYDTWTCHELDETAYYDQMHLQLPANQRMNEQLLEEWRNGELRRRPPSFL